MLDGRKGIPGALWWVAAGASLWGTDTFLRRPLTTRFSSPEIVFAEHCILFLLLAPVVWNKRREWLRLEPLEWMAVLGISWGGSALATLLFTEAIRLGSPTTAVLLQKAQPLFASLLAGLVLSEPLGMRFWTRCAIALSGAYLINFGFGLPGTSGEIVPAALCALGAAAAWGSSTVLGRFLLNRMSFAGLTAIRITAALPLLGIIAAVNRGTNARSLEQLNVDSLLSFAMLALVPGLLGLIVYYRGLSRSLASQASVAELCFPCTALLLNWLRFGTSISAVQALGFALLCGAILSWERESKQSLRGTDCRTTSLPQEEVSA